MNDTHVVLRVRRDNFEILFVPNFTEDSNTLQRVKIPHSHGEVADVVFSVPVGLIWRLKAAGHWDTFEYAMEQLALDHIEELKQEHDSNL